MESAKSAQLDLLTPPPSYAPTQEDAQPTKSCKEEFVFADQDSAAMFQADAQTARLCQEVSFSTGTACSVL